MTHIAKEGDIVAVIQTVSWSGKHILRKQVVKKTTATQIVLDNGDRYRANGRGIGDAPGMIELWCEKHDKIFAQAEASRRFNNAINFLSYHDNRRHLTADERAAIIAMCDRVEAIKNGEGK